MTKFAMASIAALLSLYAPSGWCATPAESLKLADASYRPKAGLNVTVPNAQTTSFFEIVEDLAAKSGFELQHNLSGLPLKDGRRTIFLMFARQDGVEIAVANPFHQDDMIVTFYDKRETGAWKSVYDKFMNGFEGAWVLG
jgi:hypothetical protein